MGLRTLRRSGDSDLKMTVRSHRGGTMGDQIVTETIAWSWCLEEKARPCVRQKSEGPRWRLR